MEFKFLPERVRQAIIKIDVDFLYEIRFRVNFPIKIRYKENFCYLSNDGTSFDYNNSIICNQKDVEHIINFATERSIYAFNDRIKEGYLTIENGVRIGICGECVYCNNNLQTIKNFTSLNVRIPHDIDGCANEIFKYINNSDYIFNTLIVSAPFLGKTTLLKDISKKINQINNYSILIIDERGEFDKVRGENLDIIKYCNKYYAFNNAIRSMSPQIVITDELASGNDWKCVKNAVSSGVKIIASCHSDNLSSLLNKEYFIKDIFDRYVILSKAGFGVIDKVYDKEFNKI